LGGKERSPEKRKKSTSSKEAKIVREERTPQKTWETPPKATKRGKIRILSPGSIEGTTDKVLKAREPLDFKTPKEIEKREGSGKIGEEEDLSQTKNTLAASSQMRENGEGKKYKEWFIERDGGIAGIKEEKKTRLSHDGGGRHQFLQL